jgi:hypothetical protein
MSICPDCIVAGTPKSGTSSLFDYLVFHSEVCGSYIKNSRK